LNEERYEERYDIQLLLPVSDATGRIAKHKNKTQVELDSNTPTEYCAFYGTI
jgi:hypothetical protein